MILKSRSSPAFCHPPSRCTISTLFSERLKPPAFFSLFSVARSRARWWPCAFHPRSCCVNRSLARHTANAVATGHCAGGLHSNSHSSSCGSRAYRTSRKSVPRQLAHGRFGCPESGWGRRGRNRNGASSSAPPSPSPRDGTRIGRALTVYLS